MKKEKKFTKPEVEIINFAFEDIIVTSGNDPWDEGYEEGSIGGGNVPHP